MSCLRLINAMDRQKNATTPLFSLIISTTRCIFDNDDCCHSGLKQDVVPFPDRKQGRMEKIALLNKG